MTFHWPLFFWYFRSLRLLTTITSISALSFVALHTLPLSFRNDSASLFILFHSFLIACLVSPSRIDVSRFLFSQGFSRESLWFHSWLAAIASIGITLAPCAILILTGLRGWIQDIQSNPWFPLMAGTELPVLTWATALYLILLPVFRYATIRMASPDRDFKSGLGILFLFLLIGFMAWTQLQRPGPVQHWIITGFLLISTALFVLGYSTYQRTEVC